MPGAFKKLGDGLYWKQGALGRVYYERIQRGGKDQFKQVPAKDIDEARAVRVHRNIQYKQYIEGIPGASDPYAEPKVKASKATMIQVFDAYIKADCPQMDWKPRKGKALADEKRNVRFLRVWRGWNEQAVEEVRTSTLKGYAKWRKANSKRMKNGRRVDMEIQTLKAALHNAATDDLIKVNPLATLDLGTFQTGEVAHCKFRRPENAEQLHALARWMFERKSGTRSDILGFQCLFEALTGVRTSEALRCRWDAKYGEPGFIDGEYMHLARSKQGVNPWVKIHPALKQLLDVMKLWRSTNERYKDSPWFFPSPVDPMKKAIGSTALVHALSDAAAEVCPGLKLTSHGLRSYYVTARRSDFEPGKTMPPSDAEIAAEIGDVSGASIIIQVYGALPPNWSKSTEGKITWLPSKADAKGKVMEPAWTALGFDTAKMIPLPKAAAR
jgi:integrase